MLVVLSFTRYDSLLMHSIFMFWKRFRLIPIGVCNAFRTGVNGYHSTDYSFIH